MAANLLYPGQAARLRGKLGFAVVAAFERFGRAQLSALKRRQYASGINDLIQAHCGLAGPVAVVAGQFFLFTASERPSISANHVLLAYSDGEGSGSGALSLTFLDRATQFCGGVAPEEIIRRWGGTQNTHRIETLGPAILLLPWPAQL